MLTATSIFIFQGGVFFVTQGFLNLMLVTIERVSAEEGDILFFSYGHSDLSPTAVLTFVVFHQTDCSSLIVSESPSTRLVLKQVSSSCDNYSTASNMKSAGCAQRYTDDILELERGVCSSSEPGSCLEASSSSFAGVTWCEPSRAFRAA